MSFKKIMIICATAIVCCLILIFPNFIKSEPKPSTFQNKFSMVSVGEYRVVILNENTKEVYKVDAYPDRIEVTKASLE